MPHAWDYVGAGYGIATVGISAYVVWVSRRTRRLRRILRSDSDG